MANPLSREGSTALIDFDEYEVMSFDCYGTLIDWERGLISGIRPVLERHDFKATDEEILRSRLARRAVYSRSPRWTPT